MDTGTSDADRLPIPNQLLITLRKGRGWGRPRLAKELDLICRREGWASPGLAAIEKQIYRLETGRVSQPDEFYRRLYSTAYGKSERELFGDQEQQPTAIGSQFRARSHKFIPAYVGPKACEELQRNMSLAVQPEQWLDCYSGEVPIAEGKCQLYVWPFGVAMFHLLEVREMSSLAELSVWRKATYAANREWADAKLSALAGREVAGTSYVLSAYWLDSFIWGSGELETALRIMCIPRVLRERDEHSGESELEQALLVERSLLKQGFSHPEIIDFGMKGVSLGYASWSGVVYCPLASERSLAESEIVNCELTVQAIWAYCEYIRAQVECGEDPQVPDSCGWRFLRGVRSRLTAERPTETTQHRSMREAIMETSGLSRHLSQAVEIMRESER